MDATKTLKKQSLNQRINAILSTIQGKTYTMAIATIVVILLMIVLAIVPAYTSLTDQMALNTLKEKYLVDMDTKQNILNTLFEVRDSNQTSLTLLDTYLKDKINNEYFVASFYQVAEDLNCEFKGASFSAPAVSKNIKNLNANVIGIKFSASFICKISGVKPLYARIANFPILVYIDAINYSNKKDAGGSGTNNFINDNLAVSISGEYFYWNAKTIQNAVEFNYE